MAGEPWCFPPETIARMTDYQIDEVYLKPAVERAKAMEAERKGLPAELPPAASPNDKPMTKPPPRAAMVGTMTGMLGYTVEAANAEYDRQLAEWHRLRGSAAPNKS